MLRKAVFVMCATLAAGCGASEEQQIEHVVHDYHQATADGDIDKACDLTADEMWTEAPCEDIVKLNGLPDRRGAVLKLADGDYEVTIEGDEATAQDQNLGIFRLRKIDGDWKLIDSR